MEIVNYLSVIEAHKLLIKANMYKLPNYMYDNTDDELKDELTKFVNKYELDVSIVKKLTLSLINNYCRIKTLNKACFSEPEEISDDETGYESEINDEICDESEASDEEHEITVSTNKKPIITDKEHENDLRIILKQAIKNNDRELMITTMELLKKFDENKSNTSTTISTKTPNWLIPLKCTVNPENNKKLCNQSFKYATAASKTTGDKKFRLTNIEKHLNEFNFDNITYPPNINDYITFENNNLSIKLIIFKEASKEKRLCFKYNDTNKNDRPNKLFLIHLNSDHYIYVTKSELLLRKYVINTD